MMTGMDIEIAPLGTEADSRWIRASIDEEPQSQVEPWGQVVFMASCVRCLPAVSYALFANREDADDWVLHHIADTGHPAGWSYALWRPVVTATV